MATVLMVCSGNLCRSPAAALLLQTHLPDQVEVISAGTAANEGDAIPRQMRKELRANGLDGRAHRARRITRAMVDRADLIIPMAQRQRQYVALMTPDASERTFVLGHLAALAQAVPPPPGESVAERIARVPAMGAHHLQDMVGSRSGDIPDPYGGKAAEYQASYRIIRDMVSTVAGWISVGDTAGVAQQAHDAPLDRR
ncbi:arsenate reductase/protein-tyrosine-phosphatase family protein [Demequina iriomotensis]|uniref:arsenate reductase/protein-tyrosine-phosphatase family protein n=1 Tax=Demequina iriomotensis TaxID=1536641 RepID=UPI0007817C31|nr:low molecular weight phosphatase family protein [Demequina iriomotensis]